MLTPKTRRIALLFDGKDAAARDVIAGVADYLAASRSRSGWQLFLGDELGAGPEHIGGWQGDGIIADVDNPAVAACIRGWRLPVVGVGSALADPAPPPAAPPHVCCDNQAIVHLGYRHLVESGLRHFAMCSVPQARQSGWAREREDAFASLMAGEGMAPAIFRGACGHAPASSEALREQVAWLQGLPKPVGILALNDALARQLMQACAVAGLAVPEQVALVGIGDDPLARMLARIPLSSVNTGAQEMGRAAAALLDQLLHGVRPVQTRVLVAPAGVNAQASSRHEPARHPQVMRARHFIRQHACQGIKTEQVADHVGMSRSSLESHFRQALGRSVHDEILRLRLDAATAILAQGDCKLAEVAQRCGFTSSQYMHSVFKRELGCSPRGWQERTLGRDGSAAGTLAGGAPA